MEQSVLLSWNNSEDHRGDILMYAIIETGGKQYRVQKGDVIDVELLETSAQGTIDFNHVLFVNDGSAIKVGSPYIQAGLVRAEFLQEIKGPKEIAFKYKRRKRIRRKVGHRQRYSRIKITEIVG
jgi:large subunit ribosomal protein L21